MPQVTTGYKFIQACGGVRASPLSKQLAGLVATDKIVSTSTIFCVYWAGVGWRPEI